MHRAALAALQEAAQRPWPDGALGSVVGVTCSYAPLELLHAAGFVPVRLRHSGRQGTAADSWLPPFTCAVVRGILTRALEGQFDGLAAVVLPHTCDSVQELAGIWQALQPDRWLVTFSEPLAVESPRARAYLQQELIALSQRLNRPVSDESLAASLSLYNRLRRAVQGLDGLRDRLPAAEAWAAIAAAWQMAPEAYVETAEALMRELRAVDRRPVHGPALVVAGSLLDEPLIPEIIDELGACVVGDDLCNGTRDAEVLASEVGNPWAALAERLLRRPPCPCKHATGASLTSRVAGLATRRGAHGVVQVLTKFCDPHAFDAVAIGQAVTATGRAWLPLETDATNPPEALRTRLQAFIELLAAEPAGGGP